MDSTPAEILAEVPPHETSASFLLDANSTHTVYPRPFPALETMSRRLFWAKSNAVPVFRRCPDPPDYACTFHHSPCNLVVVMNFFIPRFTFPFRYWRTVAASAE